MRSIVDQMLAKVEEKEPDVLIAPEVEQEFVPIDIQDAILKADFSDEFNEDEEQEELPAEEDGVELADPMLATLNVLSIVAAKQYPYGGFINDEDDEDIKAEWGGESPPNPYSQQEEDI